MYNSNLIYTIYPPSFERQDVLDTFFVNALWRDHIVHNAEKNATFLVDGHIPFKIVSDDVRPKKNSDMYYAVDELDSGEGKIIPLWMFGLLY